MKILREYIRELLSGQAEVPLKLYHATYEHLLPSIKLHGLGGDRDTQWEDSVQGIVYLAIDPNIAESYAETAEAYEENEDYKIVILEINTSRLDQKLFQIDRNVLDNDGSTVEYHGIIPPSEIKKFNRSGGL